MRLWNDGICSCRSHKSEWYQPCFNKNIYIYIFVMPWRRTNYHESWSVTAMSLIDVACCYHGNVHLIMSACELRLITTWSAGRNHGYPLWHAEIFREERTDNHYTSLSVEGPCLEFVVQPNAMKSSPIGLEKTSQSGNTACTSAHSTL